MNPQRFKKVEEIYHAALNISPKDRDIFLLENCADDDELLKEIKSLLSFENTFDSFIDTPPESLAADMFAKSQTAPVHPTQINQYNIISLLGKGGMGEVYLAHDTKLERKVAIKLLTKEFAGETTKLNRFFREAKAASALNHPNILTVHEIGELNDTHFIVTEFIQGKTLLHHLAENKASLQKMLEIATQIASALAAAHEAGIVHRDIKPDNIMVRTDGIVKVLDFGIAKLITVRGKDYPTLKNIEDDPTLIAPASNQQNAETPETLPGMIIGTPQYMSPEQARGQNIDSRSDIFSFGVVLYQMLAGSPPFSGITNVDILGSILKDEPKPLRIYQPEIPPGIELIVHKALHKDREHRYQQIGDLLIDLKDAKQTLELEPKLVHHTASAKALTTAQTTSGIVTQRRFSLIHIILFLLPAAILSAVVWQFLPTTTGNRVESPLKSAEVVSWSSMSGEVYSIGSFSPDGKMVAFASTQSGGKNIRIKQTNAGDAVQITNDEFRNENPIWSPTGEELAFFSTRGDQAGFWRIPILGGSPKLITTIDDASSILRSWSKSGFVYYESKGDIFACDINSGKTKQITEFRAKSLESTSISISADEQQILYVTVEGETWNIWVKKLNPDAPKKLFTTAGEVKFTAWHPDNQRIFYSSIIDGTFQVFVIGLNDTTPKQVTFAERDSFVLDITSDGTKILYGSAKEDSDIWSYDSKEKKESIIASEISSELWANVSPDGQSIAYQAVTNLSQGNNLFNGRILIKKLNSDKPPTLIAEEGFLPVWSPNGQTLAYMREIAGKHRIETINVATGGQKVLVADDTARISNTLLPYNRIQTADFSWSPDSSKIAYISRRSGQLNVWLANADGTTDAQLTDNTDPKLYFYCPLWSPDGKQIAFTSKTGNSMSEGKPTFGLWIIDTEKNTSKPVTQSNSFLRLLGWKQSGKGLVLAGTSGFDTVGLQPEVKLIEIELATGKMREIAGLKDTYLYNIHLSPDGKSIAFAAHREGKDNLWMMSDTGGEAKKLTSNNDSRLYISSLAWSPAGNSIFFGKQSRYSLLSMVSNFK